MNLIEAWKKAKYGQSMSRYHGETNKKEAKNDFHSFIIKIIADAYDNNGAGQINFDLLADDWEIVKENKKVSGPVEIEAENTYALHGLKNLIIKEGYNPKDLHRKNAKVTLEWED